MKLWVLLAVLIPTVCQAKIYDMLANDDPGYKYFACINNEALRYSRLPESAEVVATAAIQNCSDYEAKHVFRNGLGDQLTPSQKIDIIEKLHEKARPFAIKAVLDERLKNER